MLDRAGSRGARLPRRAAGGAAGSAGAPRAAAAARPSSASAPQPGQARRRRSASRPRAGCGTSRSKRWRCSGDRVAGPRDRLRPALGPPARRDQAAAATRTARNCSRNSPTSYGYRSHAAAGARRRRVAARDRSLLRRPVRPRQRPPAPAQLHARAGARRGSGRRHGSASRSAVDLDRARRPGARRDAARHGDRADYVVLARGGYIDGPAHHLRDWRIMPVGTYIVATEPLGEAAHARPDARERRRVRRELRARLFPALGRPPPAVRRPRQLLRPRRAQHRPRHARADAARLPAARRRARRPRLGRLRGHHDEPRAGLRPPRAERATTCRDSPATASR